MTTQTEQLTREQILAMPAGLEMDALVAQRVFGYQVLGLVDCWYEGGWTVMGPPSEDGQSRPAFLDHCLCSPKFDAFPKVYGHLYSCLRVVPEYSEEMEAAWTILRPVMDGGRDRGGMGDVVVQWDPYECYWKVTFNWSYNKPECAVAETASLAICRAALLATLTAPPA